MSEETMTENILLDIALANPRGIRIVPFTKKVESKTGADWEWCFWSPSKNQFTRMLVQAKRLDRRERRYSSIYQNIGKSTTRQIDRLIQRAGNRSIPAIYAFYNHLTDVGRLPLSSFKSEEWGVSVASARKVRALRNNSFDVIKGVSTPWHCLVCKPVGTSIAQHVFNTLRDQILSAMRTPLSGPPSDDESESLAVESGIPPYISEIRDYIGAEREGRGDEILESMADRYPDIDGIVLVVDDEDPYLATSSAVSSAL